MPVVRVARALQAAGHEVKLLVPPALADSAQRAGLPYWVGDEPPRAFVGDLWQRVRAGPADAVAGLFDRELFAGRSTEVMLGPAREARDWWQPQFVVRDPCEYASAIVAHEAGIPQAQVGISLSAIESGVLSMVAPIIERSASGVADAIASSPYLSSFPPSLDPSPWSDTRRFRAGAGRGEPTGARPWSHHLDAELRRGREPPLVYVTFGSVLGHLPEATAVFRCVLEAVAGLPVRVLLTVGRATDPKSLGSIPENTRVEPWVAQDDVLARAALVVCHGGSGTTFGALAAGVPVVVCPLFADQRRNAQIVKQSGAGAALGGHIPVAGGLGSLGRDDVAPLRARIEEVLDAPSYRRAARRIADEIATLPTLDDLIRELL